MSVCPVCVSLVQRGYWSETPPDGGVLSAAGGYRGMHQPTAAVSAAPALSATCCDRPAEMRTNRTSRVIRATAFVEETKRDHLISMRC